MKVTKSFTFDAAHRVLGHEGKCKYLHGHTYVAEIRMIRQVAHVDLDRLGMVFDFGDLKRLVGDWINANWDHNVILHPEDPLLRVDSVEERVGRSPFIMPGGLVQPLAWPSPLNPTAENMARVLFMATRNLLTAHPATVQNVRIYETPSCWADYPG
jgi:6-pyruvoyltetrahydropterin/6-carboxytetrahydropterin synthase